ncbi:MAG: 3-methyl-2-oxobutanoate hydroxymethyltransferase [Candidatus Omnitrophota bacterium]
MDTITVKEIITKKGNQKITMLTCYDFSFAQLLDEAGVDMLLVGDSLANVLLGLTETRKVSFAQMLTHTAAVARAVKHSLVVADMPYVSYQKNPGKSLIYARKFMEAGARAVKIEWFDGAKRTSQGPKDCPAIIGNLIKNNIPVMGHIGLTPQTAHLLGGYKVQGKDKESAMRLVKQAKYLEELGVFSIVLECIPYQLAHYITANVNIPTIGIGAGAYCDGQVLVLYDMLGLYKKIKPKFVRVYKDLSLHVKEGVAAFIADVQGVAFPHPEESFSMKEEEWNALLTLLHSK